MAGAKGTEFSPRSFLEKQNDECGGHDKGGACAVPDARPRLTAVKLSLNTSNQFLPLDPGFGANIDILNHC